ncbi:MAG: 2-succinyl-5-enolpyruvyl-6-hydroxy-3-cyclohexene-1-carboxylic-acid synthase [Solirubrobacterales bacterium]|nr:2-succinyl-5-enolpyruvyl-6-hydroxy-3-cyclohexene-1-carboxylic-acid synthase [Solirubrobacterales bacterium]
MTTIDTYCLLRAFCDELVRCGMREACTSPGSRNTPLVLSLVREPGIRCFSHIDERSAGFFALGAAKASGRPVAVTCTSGTAAANLAPAVIEASWARVPLIVLTADRPAELRDVGAGQAIDQLKLFGDAPRWFLEAELPAADATGLRWIRQLACRSYWTALGEPPGPVHLNVPLREPLVLDEPLELDDPIPGRPDGRPWVDRAPPAARPAGQRRLAPRGVIVAGAAEPAVGDAVRRCAARTGYPVLADPLSGARESAAAVASYDLLVRDPEFAAAMAPEIVVRAGDLPTSKPLRAWLASLAQARQLALSPWQDPDAVVSEALGGDPVAALDSLEATGDPGYAAAWHDADGVVRAAVRDELGDGLSEPLVAALLGDWLPPRATLVVASSMPIRDVELHLPAGVPLPRVLANRGANGIDGTVSTAFGVAAATGGPVVLLIGDVALLHDLGGLLAARRLGVEVTIVALNNDGGGIFHFLPVSSQADAFEEHVATPHGLDLAAVAGLFEIAYERPGGARELERALARGGRRLIEIVTDRHENLEGHRRLAARGLGALAVSRRARAASPRA